MKRSDLLNVFIAPEDYAPLSAFTRATGVPQGLAVPAVVLRWLRETGQPLLIAAEHDGCMTTVEATVDESADAVTFTAPAGSRCVAVSPALRSRLPIVTHWDGTADDGAGAWTPGATDGVGLLDLDMEKGIVTSALDTSDPDPESPYTLSDRWNLFSSPGETARHRVPAYERYVGEGFSLMRVSDRLAAWVAAKVLEKTGFPLLYLDPGTPPAIGCPAVQVVCNRIVDRDGRHPSLAMFILPPYWTPRPQRRYPTLFLGFYDNNDTFFKGDSGVNFSAAVARCAAGLGQGAIGIIWNGGGTGATRTMQFSAYANLSELFAVAERDYGADRQSIVACGGSRGGITALAAAGNPYFDDYRIRYAVVYNPIVYFGDRDVGMMSPSTPLIYAVVSDDVGYKYAWRPGWREPGTGATADELLVENLTGTRHPEVANGALSPYAPPFAASMARRGTRVLLFVGTHDGFATKDPIIDMAEGLAAAGVPLHLQIGYRWGHGGVDNLEERAAQILFAMVRGEEVELSGVSHYRRVDGAADTFPTPEKIEPDHQPVFFEGTKTVALGDRARLNLVGPAGTRLRLAVTPIDEMAWTQEQRVQLCGAPIPLMDVTLEDIAPHLQGHPSYARDVLRADGRFAVGFYVYTCDYLLPGETRWRSLPPQSTPHIEEKHVPLLQVVSDYPMLPGTPAALAMAPWFLGWGMCEV